jgi:3-deoxy-7-phosphoheptulonate synthase
MIIVMKTGTATQEINQIIQDVTQWNVKAETIESNNKVVIGLVGDTSSLNIEQVQQLSPFIEQVLRINKPFKRASLEFRHGKQQVLSFYVEEHTNPVLHPTLSKDMERVL